MEIQDTRRGPGAGLANGLLSWQLQLIYAEPQPKAIFLTNGLTYSGMLTNDQTNYFVVDVCETTKGVYRPDGRHQQTGHAA